MWSILARFIIRYRIPLLSVLIVITGFMAYIGKDVVPTFKFAELVPKEDPDQKAFDAFKLTFGQDANAFAIGFEGESIKKLEDFKIYAQLIEDISKVEGLDTVIGLSNLPRLVVNKEQKRYSTEPIFKRIPETQAELDSIINYIKTLKIYENQIFDKRTNASLVMVAINNDYVNSNVRQDIVKDIELLCKEACARMSHQKEAHFAGIPYVRTILTGKVQAELKLFLYLSLAVTAVVLFVFFRSFAAVIVPLIVIGVAVVWTMGTLVLFDYKITMLTGLIPPIIVIIGIPNCVYLLNKYHQEFVLKGSRIRALEAVIRKIGIVTLITNTTTAIGFLVLISAKITILREFGVVAGINVFSTFIISVVMIPVVFSFLPNPTNRQLKHLDGKGLQKILEFVCHIVSTRRTVIYIVTCLIVVVSSFGVWKVYSVSFMVDDIPEKDKVKVDLKFFEQRFNGVMPLEIVLNTGDKNAFKDRDLMLKIDQFEKYIASQPELSKPVSYLSFLKSANQAYYGDDSTFYQVPSKQDKNKLLLYLVKSTKNSGGENALSKFVDTTGKIRLSIKVADIGSKRMDTLINQKVIPKAKEIFESSTNVKVQATGTTLLFIKGINYLIDNLRSSLVIAIVLIAIIMAMLFRSSLMISLSLVTNLIPIIITGALMGYFDIPLKPSTALIFSIAFGISVDDSIHYLAKFRQELFLNNFNVYESVKKSIIETGGSMMYTSIILFFGFIIFAGSNFIGTRMLGILTSTTLLMAMVTNLVLLPALLLTFDSGKRKGRLTRRLIDTYNDQDKLD